MKTFTPPPPKFAAVLILILCLTAETMKAQCPSPSDNCTLITNGGFENGTGGAYGAIGLHYAPCWDASNVSPYLCESSTENTADVFDVNQSPTNNYGSCTPGEGGFSIPKNYLSNPDVAGGEVLVRPGSVGTRYAGMIPTEQMHTSLAAPMQAKKYWLDFYAAATFCITQYSSALCIRLVEAVNPPNYFTVSSAFVINDQTATGEWNYYGMCVDLQTPNVSGFNRLSVQNIGPDIAAYDDFRLVQLADAGEDAAICNGEHVTLSAGALDCCIEDATYSWSPSTGLSCTVCCNPTATPSVTTTYTVTVTSPDWQCTATDEVTITVNTAPTFTIVGDLNSCTASAYCATGYSGSPTFAWAAYYNSDPNNSFASGTGSCSSNLLFAQDGFIVFSSWYAGQTCTTTVTLEVYQCCFKTGQGTLLDDTNSTAAFPSGTVTGGTYYINNTFTVNSNLICNGVNFKMAPYAKIVIQNGNKLTLKKPNGGSSTVVEAGCEVMWDYIEIQQGGELEVKGSIIRDGISAVISQGGAKFTFETTSQLLDNYRSIVINTYAGTHPGSIKKTTITGNTSLPYPPYQGEDSYSGIEVNDVTTATLGDAVASANSCTLETLRFGIIAKNSSITVKNMVIQNLLIPALGCHICQCTEGTGICAYTTTSTARSLTVGGSGSYDRVTFQQTAHEATGIHTYGKINTTATYNSFLNLNTGIMIENASGLSYTQNLNYNTLEKFTTGINCKNVDYSTVSIGSNSFNAGISSGTIGTYGIIVQNVNSVPLNLSITDNGTASAPIQRVRTGISLIKVCGFSTYSVNVNSNYIDFPQLQGGTVSSNHFGIRIQNCVGNEIGNNVITKPGDNPQSSTVQKLRGISFENSNTSHIFQNAMTQMGSGIYGLGACNSSRIECNSMTSCYDGCYFSNANTGNQISPGNINTDNQWNSNINQYKVEGSLANPTVWFYNPLVTSMDPSPYQCTNFSVPQSGNVNNLCSQAGGKLTDDTDSSELRDELIGAIVSGENDYVKNDAALKIWDEQFAYSILYSDTSLINLGNDADIVYQNYYDSISSTNTGWIQKSIDYISNGRFDSASYANENINATNEIESNRKTVNEILLVYSQMELPKLDSEQIKILTPLAYGDPLTNGEAVYAARVLLGVDPDGNVKYEDETEEFSTDQFQWLKIYPNPASNQLNIVCNTDAAPVTLNVYSITGILVLQLELVQEQTTVAISNLNEGIYILRARSGDLHACYNKLIVSE